MNRSTSSFSIVGAGIVGLLIAYRGIVNMTLARSECSTRDPILGMNGSSVMCLALHIAEWMRDTSH